MNADRHGDRVALAVLALLVGLAALRGTAAARRRPGPEPPAHWVPMPGRGCGHCHVV